MSKYKVSTYKNRADLPSCFLSLTCQVLYKVLLSVFLTVGRRLDRSSGDAPRPRPRRYGRCPQSRKPPPSAPPAPPLLSAVCVCGVLREFVLLLLTRKHENPVPVTSHGSAAPPAVPPASRRGPPRNHDDASQSHTPLAVQKSKARTEISSISSSRAVCLSLWLSY